MSTNTYNFSLNYSFIIILLILLMIFLIDFINIEEYNKRVKDNLLFSKLLQTINSDIIL